MAIVTPVETPSGDRRQLAHERLFPTLHDRLAENLQGRVAVVEPGRGLAPLLAVVAARPVAAAVFFLHAGDPWSK